MIGVRGALTGLQIIHRQQLPTLRDDPINIRTKFETFKEGLCKFSVGKCAARIKMYYDGHRRRAYNIIMMI